MTSRNVFLVLTNDCNQRCKFCYNVASDRKGSMKGEDFKFALNWIKEHYSPQGTLVRLTGGEPTLHKGLVEYIREIYRSDLKAMLITNGTKFEELYPELKDYGHFLQVQFSIEGHTSKLHDEITGKRGSFNRLVQAIKLAKETFEVNTNTTLSKLNLSYIFEVFEFLHNLGVRRSSLNYSTPTEANLDIVPDFYTISEVYRKLRYLSDILDTDLSTLMHIPMCISREGKGCAVGNGDITIDPFLNAYPCPSVSFADTCMGNIRRADLEMLFGAEIYRNLSSEFNHLPKGCQACRYVKRCKGGCYLFWRLGLMSGYELKEENAEKIWGNSNSTVGFVESC